MFKGRACKIVYHEDWQAKCGEATTTQRKKDADRIVTIHAAITTRV
jgi:hypothetical protein